MIIRPILQKEFLSRMRGWRSPLIITLYLGALSFISLVFLYNTLGVYRYGGAMHDQGRAFFYLLSFFQLGLVAFITPALTAGSLSSEREMQTLDLLLCSRLSPGAIVTGKLLASTSYILLLVVSSLPVFALVFFFGGVSPRDLGLLFFYYLVCAFTFGSIGVFWSALIKKTQFATVAAYVTLFGMFFATLLILTLVSPDYAFLQENPGYISPLLYLNPGAMLLSVFPQEGHSSLPFSGPQALTVARTLPAWGGACLLYASLSLALLGASSRIIQPAGFFARGWGRGKRVKGPGLDNR